MADIWFTSRFVLLMKLTALAVSGYQTVLYKSYVMPESLSNVSQHHPVTAISALHCGFNCMSEEGCYGLTYDWLTKKCSTKSCVNPNLYSEGQSGGYDFYIRADIGDNFSNLLARNKLAKMSSLYVRAAGGPALSAASAVDGIYKVKNEYQSLAHSKSEIRPWWRVDLGDVHCVWAVKILNRYGKMQYVLRSKKTEVTVAMVEEDIEFTGSNREVLCKYVDGYLNRYYTLITCDQPISGRFVQILFNAKTSLNLHEVEVHGY